jgi:hypothetical protein
MLADLALVLMRQLWGFILGVGHPLGRELDLRGDPPRDQWLRHTGLRAVRGAWLANCVLNTGNSSVSLVHVDVLLLSGSSKYS